MINAQACIDAPQLTAASLLPPDDVSGGFDNNAGMLGITPTLLESYLSAAAKISAVATGSGNFQTFNDAYNFIKCGITGPVIFNVSPGSGPYNEQVIIPESSDVSLIPEIRFSYFDPEAGRYETLVNPPIPINVRRPASAQATPSRGTPVNREAAEPAGASPDGPATAVRPR